MDNRKYHNQAPQNNQNPRREENVSAILEENGKLSFYPALVNGNRTMCLRDSGATTVIIDEKLIRNGQYNQEFKTVILANRKKVICRTANIVIDTPWITGEIKATVMKNTICPLIIGNLPQIPDNSKELFDKWIECKEKERMEYVAVATRSTDYSEENKVEENMSTCQMWDKEFMKELQDKDPNLVKIKKLAISAKGKD